MVKVEVNEYDNRFVFVPVDTYTLQNRLPGKTFEAVLNHLRTLANAELEKTYSDIVCMIMPGIGMYSDLAAVRSIAWDLIGYTPVIDGNIRTDLIDQVFRPSYGDLLFLSIAQNQITRHGQSNLIDKRKFNLL